MKEIFRGSFQTSFGDYFHINNLMNIHWHWLRKRIPSTQPFHAPAREPEDALCVANRMCKMCHKHLCGVCAAMHAKNGSKTHTCTHTECEQVPSGRWNIWNRWGSQPKGVPAAWQLSGKSQNHKSNHNTRLKVVAALAASVGGSLCVRVLLLLLWLFAACKPQGICQKRLWKL